MQILLMFLLILVALFMILLVLVQRGRGGGLAGALGGAGGQSAFGAKAGDTFTKITIWAAFVWLLLCVVAVKSIGSADEDNVLLDRPSGMNAPPATGAPATGAPATGEGSPTSSTPATNGGSEPSGN